MTIHTKDLTVARLAEYRRTALRRQKARVTATEPRREKAWKLARKAARILRKEYHAERVVVFGSLLHAPCFTPWSDVNIAAWGIPSDQTFRAIGAVMDLDPSLELNLVDVNACSPALLKVIEQDGVDV